jgi:hypothetical protein
MNTRLSHRLCEYILQQSLGLANEIGLKAVSRAMMSDTLLSTCIFWDIAS